MASTDLTFGSCDEHRAWLQRQGPLPRGFRIGTAKLEFAPYELPSKQAKMNLTLVTLDEPSADFAAVFTNNAFPGAPVKIGRRRLGEPRLSAILVNNKISNVCAQAAKRRRNACAKSSVSCCRCRALPSYPARRASSVGGCRSTSTDRSVEEDRAYKL